MSEQHYDLSIQEIQDLIENDLLKRKCFGSHKNQALDQICLNKNCNKYLELCCSQCIEDNFHINHKQSDFADVEIFCISLLEEIQQNENDLLPIQNEKLQTLTTLISKFENLQQQIQYIIQNIEKMKKELNQKEQKEFSEQMKINIYKALKEKNHSIETKSILKSLKDYTSLIQEDKITMKTHIKEYNQGIFEGYMRKMNKKLKEIQDAIGKDIASESAKLNFTWEFKKSTFEHSPSLKFDSQNQIFKGTGEKFQICYSNEKFIRGIHGVSFKMLTIGQNFEHFRIGLISNKNRLGNPYFDSYKCLFCQNSNLCKEININNDEAPVQMPNIVDDLEQNLIREGQIIRIITNLDEGYMRILTPEWEGKYQLQLEKNDKLEYRFMFYWYMSEVEVQLLESW